MKTSPRSAFGASLPTRRRAAVSIAALAVLSLLVALPALGADPSPKPGNPDKSKAPEVSVTLRGAISTATDADGDTIYRFVSGGKTYELDAGPRWFHGENHPLKAFVGKTVTIVGGQREGTTEIDVESVDGQALRAGGKPPWAGGWKSVGSSHPGWSQAKADRFQAKFGDCFPPGQCKKQTGTSTTPP
jgi:hypothetical protein